MSERVMHAGMFLSTLLPAGIFLFGSCTEQEYVRTFGGQMEEVIPCGQKVTVVTWKGTDLWVATRPLRPNEAPEVTTFSESSSWGLAEGVVVLRESRCKGSP